MGLQLAIGYNGDVNLWCVDRGFTPDGGQKFWVINGHWAGVYKRGVVIVDEDGHGGARIESKLLWRGFTPFADEDYNEAIEWLRTHLQRKPELTTFFEGMKFNMTKLTFNAAVEGIETDQHNERVSTLAAAYTRVTATISDLQRKIADAEAYKEELAEKGSAVETLSDKDFSELYNRQFSF